LLLENDSQYLPVTRDYSPVTCPSGRVPRQHRRYRNSIAYGWTPIE
jgi:hypothetical protein